MLILEKTITVEGTLPDSEHEIEALIDWIEDSIAIAVNSIRETWPELTILIDGQE